MVHQMLEMIMIMITMMKTMVMKTMVMIIMMSGKNYVDQMLEIIIMIMKGLRKIILTKVLTKVTNTPHRIIRMVYLKENAIGSNAIKVAQIRFVAESCCRVVCLAARWVRS